MNSKTLICLLVMMSVINIATSTSNVIATKGLHNSTENFKGSVEQDIILTTTIDYNTLVATTPKIIARQSKVLNRYEQGLDDYDEAITNAQHEEESQHVEQSRQLSDSNFNPLMQIFNAISSALTKSAMNTAKNMVAPSTRTTISSNNDNIEDNNDDNDNDNVTTEHFYDKDTSNNNSTDLAVAEGRYIKGDPLNGYYDFIITEGSYKFWVVFQLATAGLLIYSTLAAIYYSKVNPLTSDYDYVDYLSRSFNGRSLSDDSADVEDDATSESGRTYLSSLANNKWVKTAAYGFQFAMDAIDKIPQ